MNKTTLHNEQTKSIEGNEPQLHFSLYCSSDDAHHDFSVPAQMTVGDFIELALEQLAKGEGGTRIEALRANYQPVLELATPAGNRELPADKSLLEAGVHEQAVCRISGRLRKDRALFCRYSNYS